jgi:hypothetical protein
MLFAGPQGIGDHAVPWRLIDSGVFFPEFLQQCDGVLSSHGQTIFSLGVKSSGRMKLRASDEFSVFMEEVSYASSIVFVFAVFGGAQTLTATQISLVCHSYRPTFFVLHIFPGYYQT